MLPLECHYLNKAVLNAYIGNLVRTIMMMTSRRVCFNKLNCPANSHQALSTATKTKIGSAKIGPLAKIGGRRCQC